MKYFDLDEKCEADRIRVFEYLKRMYIIQFSDDLETKNTLKGTIKYLFDGNPETNYNLILNYPIENDLLGKEITSYMILNFLENQPGISLRTLNKDRRITPRIEKLNAEFMSSFIGIDNSVIHRTESERCYKELLKNNSIIIHGKAGSGKSGCVVELLNRLKQENIVHLGLKLDRRMPEYTSNGYGQQLGLPSSPVFCLDAVSAGKEAVLILDQLDAIRWTSSHSSTALEVCKEMIVEVNNINKSRDKKILLVFVCRTFDFQNDNGIKQLFSNVKENSGDTHWREILMGDLDNKDVEQVVGNGYAILSTKLKILLRTPSNLYIWSNLEVKSQNNTYRSSSDLIKEWWNQLRTKCEHIGISNQDLYELKEIIVKHIDNLGKLMIPEQFVRNCSRVAIEHLLSNGLLLSENKSIGFVHQSFYDYFLAEKMIEQIFEDSSVIDIIGPISEQTPSKRYQLQMILENLIDYDMNFFVDIGRELVESANVRFYMKYAFLEVLGQAESISSNVRLFLKTFIELDYWKPHLIDAVFIGHPIFIKFLIDEGYLSKWLNLEKDRELAMMLLRSVNSKLPTEVVSLIYPLAFKESEIDNKLFSVLCRDVTDDSDEMFEFRLELLKARPQLLGHHIHWDRIVSGAPFRALLLLDQLVKNIDSKNLGQRDYLNEKQLNILFS